jgi:hypothetical protein
MPRIDLSKLNPVALKQLSIWAGSTLLFEEYLLSLKVKPADIEIAMIEAIPGILKLSHKEKNEIKRIYRYIEES